jgi:hypothetical protein
MTWKFRCILGAVLLVVFTGWPGRWLAALNDGVYDLTLRSFPALPAARVLTFEFTPAQWTSNQVVKAVSFLRTHEVIQVVVLDPPEGLSVFSDPQVISAEPAAWRDHAWQIEDSPGHLPECVQVLPRVASGIQRGLPLTLSLAGGEVALLETRVGEAVGQPLPAGGYRIDFRVPRAGLQRFAGERLLAEALPGNLLAGQVVVLLVRSDFAEAPVTTPRHRGEAALSPTLFHAATCDAVARGGIIRFAPRWSLWLVPVLLIVAWWGVLRVRPQVGLPGVAGGFFLILLAGTWLALFQFHLWFPPLSALSILVGLAAGEAVARERSDAKTLQASLIALSTEVCERSDQEGILAAASPWPLLNRLVHQLFDLKSNG